MTRMLPVGLSAVLYMLPTVAWAAPIGAEARSRLAQAATATSELRLEESARLLEQLGSELRDSPNVHFELARLRFHQGDYADALALTDRALAGAPDTRTTRAWREYRRMIAQTLEVTQPYDRKVSPDGRYVVLYPDGKDRYLAVYALETLAAADTALQEVFGLRLPGPLRLEIYPSPTILAQVSALTVEQIETTGTVALSKWNRLMITSPKALVRGYPWADTITHELVHMVISRLTRDRAPVWLQEGTAKLFERAWRGPDAGLALDPAARALLHEAKAKGNLLTFEQMHPSIAMLPSQDDAALAFAQVATFMESYVARFGGGALRASLAEIRDGVDARTALGSAAGLAFSTIESQWRASLPADPDGAQDVRRLERRFAESRQPADESQDVVEKDARRFLRLGDLLWDRGRKTAAAVEYKKAHQADKHDPIVAARYARAALDSGDAKGAIASLAPQAELYPSHAPTHALLGSAYLMVGDKAAARAALRESIWINPFDPEPHCALSQATGDDAEREREREACEVLRE